MRTLPDFDDPPAVETALGVRFARIPGWNVFHYGLLLQVFREQYPEYQLRPAVGSIPISIRTDADFSGMPVRCWFIDHESSELVQVQDDCFIRNWRKTENSPDYRHYDVIKPRFERDWGTFIKFLDNNRLPQPEVWQCEVTYINQFVRGCEWHSFKDLGRLYPGWHSDTESPLLDKPQMVTFAAAFELPNEAGTLQFHSQPGVRSSDGAEIIQLTVTALGKPRSSEGAEILSWLDSGRAAVVQGFTDFTSESAHQLWRRKQ